MTIATRNRFFSFCIFMTLIFTVVATVAFFIILSGDFLDQFLKDTPQHAGHFYQPYNLTALLASIVLFPLLATLINGYVMFLFKKIHAVEISLFITFIFFMGFEGVRIMIPLFRLWQSNAPLVYLCSRLIFFTRILGIFVLLTSSLFAAQLTVHQPIGLGSLLCFTAFLIAGENPLNTTYLSQGFIFLPGFTKELIIVAFIFLVLTILSYARAARIKDSREYQWASIALSLLLLGYILLLLASSIIFVVLSVVSILMGSYTFAKNIYQFYLWE